MVCLHLATGNVGLLCAGLCCLHSENAGISFLQEVKLLKDQFDYSKACFRTLLEFVLQSLLVYLCHQGVALLESSLNILSTPWTLQSGSQNSSHVTCVGLGPVQLWFPG